MTKIELGETVYKYPLQVTDVQEVHLPANAQILRVDVQHESVMLWAVVDPSVEVFESRTIYCIGTGHPFRWGEATYLGTVQLEQGHLVFHFFIK